MPFDSKKQQRYMYAHPDILGKKGLKEWSSHTDFDKLPERKMHDGGVVPEDGTYQLEKGETVVPANKSSNSGFKSTHVDWHDDNSATIRHQNSDPEKDVKHGVGDANGVVVSIRKHIGVTPNYPPDHQPGMRVPKGGSNCAKCEYLGDDKKTCKNQYFIAWGGPNKPVGSDVIPGKIDEYCSDWFEPKD